MVDLIFVVRDADLQAWHKDNMRAHRDHYTNLGRALGTSAIARVQSWGPAVYYISNVKLQTRGGDEVLAKYGVMSVKALLGDLKNWASLYVAGRAHKPFAFDWQPGVDQEVRESLLAAVARNRRSAVSAALLLTCGSGAECHVSMDVDTFLTHIVKLSYDGDIREGIAENPKKIQNIVRTQRTDLWKLYSPIVSDLGLEVPAELHEDEPPVQISIDAGAAWRERLFLELPSSIQAKVKAATAGIPWEDSQALRGVLRKIVYKASVQQMVKGWFSAGIRGSIRYLAQKIEKRMAKSK
eukprot:gnl/TRDRNA2_/TRDRNA2_171890_c0_seq5.p1 gnl/TRDRNA2_/TRDRNA2_171890_c0~~gnl/TRDRNA2_/TRDRNA2_171890_c0_seq5.p1  ORF type:complete len:330 (-),score=56.41 gnl/TRDRNA2_/TRDRNA2_171890_c0_seq5:150-1037(-)